MRFLEFVRVREDMIYSSRICGKQRRGLRNVSLVRTKLREKGEETYVEHGGILESGAIGRNPLIPRDGLAPFENVFEVTIEPALRRRARKLPEWRFGVTNSMFDDEKDDYEQRGGRERES